MSMLAKNGKIFLSRSLNVNITYNAFDCVHIPFYKIIEIIK